MKLPDLPTCTPPRIPSVLASVPDLSWCRRRLFRDTDHVLLAWPFQAARGLCTWRPGAAPGAEQRLRGRVPAGCQLHAPQLLLAQVND